MTTTFPWDHPHQHGIFSAWVKTTWNKRKVDFWNIAKGTGRVAHKRVRSTFSNKSSAGFEVDLVHQTGKEPIVEILEEHWKISVHTTEDDYRCFDLETTQKALTNKPLIIQEYHYGGIALRGPTRWLQGEVKGTNPGKPETREESSFINDQGSDRIEGNLEKTRWVTLTGLLDGNAVSTTVLCHPDNFRSPQAARLHPSKPYFCFAPCADGKFAIDKAHPFHAKYRYLITDSAPDNKWLETQYQQWCGGTARQPVAKLHSGHGKLHRRYAPAGRFPQ